MKISNEPWESRFEIEQVVGEGLRDGSLEGGGWGLRSEMEGEARAWEMEVDVRWERDENF